MLRLGHRRRGEQQKAVQSTLKDDSSPTCMLCCPLYRFSHLMQISRLSHQQSFLEYLRQQLVCGLGQSRPILLVASQELLYKQHLFAPHLSEGIWPLFSSMTPPYV